MGSPPKKSTSRCLRLPERATRKSSAFLPISAGMSRRLPWKVPVEAKQ